MTNSKTVVVGDVEYKINLLPPTRSIKLLTKISKVIGEPMATMSGAGDEKKVEDLMPKAVQLLMANMDEDSVIIIIKEMMSCVFKENKSINFEIEFLGRLDVMIDLCKEVLELNYKEFLGKIMALVK